MRGNQLVLSYDSTSGCIIPTSHKPNKDGYIRLRDYRHKCRGRKPLIMFHRFIYEINYGPIPSGYEIHHSCHNRKCCNIAHLNLVEISEHKAKHNRTRYAERKEQAYEYWTNNKCSGITLADKFGVSFSASCKWIREWKCRD